MSSFIYVMWFRNFCWFLGIIEVYLILWDFDSCMCNNTEI